MIDSKAFHDFDKFEKNIKKQNRFIFDQDFIEAIEKSLALNSQILGMGNPLYRARIHDIEEPNKIPLSCKEMFNPPDEKAIRNRANPDGISYLYLSFDKTTCIKEVKPSLNDTLTIAQFFLKKEIKVVDLTCSFPPSENNYITSLNHKIHLTFSKRLKSKRPEIDYLPTQFLSELAKKSYYGIKYDSCYGTGINNQSFNLVLFDRNLVFCDESKSELLKVLSVEYKTY